MFHQPKRYLSAQNAANLITSIELKQGISYRTDSLVTGELTDPVMISVPCLHLVLVSETKSRTDSQQLDDFPSWRMLGEFTVGFTITTARRRGDWKTLMRAQQDFMLSQIQSQDEFIGEREEDRVWHEKNSSFVPNHFEALLNDSSMFSVPPPDIIENRKDEFIPVLPRQSSVSRSFVNPAHYIVENKHAADFETKSIAVSANKPRLDSFTSQPRLVSVNESDQHEPAGSHMRARKQSVSISSASPVSEVLFLYI